MNHLEQIKNLQKKFQNDINVVCNEIRTEIIIPFCSRFQLEYLAAPGCTWAFFPIGSKSVVEGLTTHSISDFYTYGLVSIAQKKLGKPGFEEFNKIVTILDTQSGIGNFVIGYLISNVKANDLK